MVPPYLPLFCPHTIQFKTFCHHAASSFLNCFLPASCLLHLTSCHNSLSCCLVVSVGSLQASRPHHFLAPCLLACLLTAMLAGKSPDPACEPGPTNHDGDMYRRFAGNIIGLGEGRRNCANIGSQLYYVHTPKEDEITGLRLSIQ